MLRVVHKIIFRRYLKNADGVHVFFKSFGNLINSLMEKNNHKKCGKKFTQQIAQLRVKPVEPHRVA